MYISKPQIQLIASKLSIVFAVLALFVASSAFANPYRCFRLFGVERPDLAGVQVDTKAVEISTEKGPLMTEVFGLIPWKTLEIEPKLRTDLPKWLVSTRGLLTSNTMFEKTGSVAAVEMIRDRRRVDMALSQVSRDTGLEVKTAKQVIDTMLKNAESDFLKNAPGLVTPQVQEGKLRLQINQLERLRQFVEMLSESNPAWGGKFEPVVADMIRAYGDLFLNLKVAANNKSIDFAGVMRFIKPIEEMILLAEVFNKFDLFLDVSIFNKGNFPIEQQRPAVEALLVDLLVYLNSVRKQLDPDITMYAFERLENTVQVFKEAAIDSMLIINVGLFHQVSNRILDQIHLKYAELEVTGKKAPPVETIRQLLLGLQYAVYTQQALGKGLADLEIQLIENVIYFKSMLLALEKNPDQVMVESEQIETNYKTP